MYQKFSTFIKMPRGLFQDSSYFSIYYVENFFVFYVILKKSALMVENLSYVKMIFLANLTKEKFKTFFIL